MRDRLRLRRHDLQPHRRALPSLQQNPIGIVRRRAITLMLHLSAQLSDCSSHFEIAADRSISRACRVFLRNVVSRSMNHPFRADNTRENSVSGDLFFTTCNIARPHDAMHFAFQADMLKIAFYFGRERENYIRTTGCFRSEFDFDSKPTR